MRICLAMIALAFTTVPAYAMDYYLSGQWFEGGSHFCRYSNGTVLNVGVSLCPLSIHG